MTNAGIVIAGAGHAGGSAAAALRQQGWQGAITLVGMEPVAPYQRPPLSKAWLKGETDAERLALRPASFYADNGIDLQLGMSVLAIDRRALAVTLGNGVRRACDRLILATGSRLRRIDVPGIDLAGVMELRTAADADRLKGCLGPGKRLVVIGGGYIGLEVAASARGLGTDVVVIEREPRVLARVASTALSAYFQRHHEAHGVRIELGASLAGLIGSAGRVEAVCLGDGRVIACDGVLLGVGAVANDGLARSAGLVCDNGIVVDIAARTSDPKIYAIGDCTRRPLPRYGGLARLESVPNALEQAKQAAADICGRPAPVPEVPWFWSDQYDVRLQIAGLPYAVARIVVRGNPEAGRFAVFHLTAEGHVQSVEAINSAAEFMAGRLMIAKRGRVLPEQIQDMSLSMKEISALGHTKAD